MAGKTKRVAYIQEGELDKMTRTCRICGCTDDNCSQCIEAQGYPCSWAEPDLCSRCKDELEEEADTHNEIMREEEDWDEEERDQEEE